MKRAIAFLAAAAAAATAGPAAAYCPSYGKASGCVVEPVPGKNPDPATFRLYFDKVGTGLFTKDEGPALLPMTSGCDKPKPETKGPALFPCHVLYGLAQQ